MTEQRSGRYELIIKEGSPRGDLFELEQATYFHILDTRSAEIIMTFRGDLEASLSQDTGLWTDYRYSGVAEILITPDELAVIVRYFDGREETIPLPE